MTDKTNELRPCDGEQNNNPATGATTIGAIGHFEAQIKAAKDRDPFVVYSAKDILSMLAEIKSVEVWEIACRESPTTRTPDTPEAAKPCCEVCGHIIDVHGDSVYGGAGCFVCWQSGGEFLHEFSLDTPEAEAVFMGSERENWRCPVAGLCLKPEDIENIAECLTARLSDYCPEMDTQGVQLVVQREINEWLSISGEEPDKPYMGRL